MTTPILRADGASPDLETVEAAGIRWEALASVGETDVKWIRDAHSFHLLAMEDLVSRNQRPKVDDYGSELFVVLYFPRLDPATGRLEAVEMNLFVGRDFIVSVPRAGIPGVGELFGRYRADPAVRAEDFARGTGFVLYRIIDAAIDSGFPILRRIGDDLESIEADLMTRRPGIVQAIATAKMNIIDYRRVVRPQRATYRQLKRATRARDGSGDLAPYFDDLVDASERTWDVLEADRELVQGLETTDESIRAKRVNDAVRVLTAWSVVILPLTLVASLFGMNVRVPGEGEAAAFWAIVIGMVIALILTIRYFRHRDWL